MKSKCIKFRYGPLPHENQKVTMKIGPLVCTPPEEFHKTTIMLKFDEIQEKIQANIENQSAEFTDNKAQLNETLKGFRDEIEDVKDEVSTKASTADLNKKFEAEKVTINETLEVFSAEFVNVAQHNVVNGKDVFKTCMGR